MPTSKIFSAVSPDWAVSPDFIVQCPLLEHDLFGKPAPSFPDHAIGAESCASGLGKHLAAATAEGKRVVQTGARQPVAAVPAFAARTTTLPHAVGQRGLPAELLPAHRRAGFFRRRLRREPLVPMGADEA